MSPMALSMKPTGWFQIGWSAEIGAGEVKPMRYFGHDLVAYRTEAGKLVVLNAYCEHLGANMAYGGEVVGEDIECPFHKWRWNAKGKNTCIPYQKATNRVRRIHPWTVLERDGLMYIWHDAEGNEPTYEVPSVFELFERSGPAERYHPAFPEGTFEKIGVPVHPQYVMENGVDFAHFKYVHRADEVATVKFREFGEHDFKSELLLKYKQRNAAGELITVDAITEAYSLGIGIGMSWATAVGDICSITTVTPIDDEQSVIRFSGWASKEDDDDTNLARRQRSAVKQFCADLTIWEHQRYTEPPGLATAEAAGFRDVRQWARRFYPAGHKGHDAVDQLAATDEYTDVEAVTETELVK